MAQGSSLSLSSLIAPRNTLFPGYGVLSVSETVDILTPPTLAGDLQTAWKCPRLPQWLQVSPLAGHWALVWVDCFPHQAHFLCFMFAAAALPALWFV